VNRGGLRGQVVDHVLIILSNALQIIQGLTVEREAHSIWPITDVKILRANTSDDPDLTAFYTVGLSRK